MSRLNNYTNRETVTSVVGEDNTTLVELPVACIVVSPVSEGVACCDGVGAPLGVGGTVGGRGEGFGVGFGVGFEVGGGGGVGL